MTRGDRARMATWLQVPCPVCAANAGQRCRIAPGSFQAIYHAERSIAEGTRKPVASVGAADDLNRRIA